jgi:putative transposase
MSVHFLQVRNFLPKAEEVVRKIGHFLDHTLVFCGGIRGAKFIEVFNHERPHEALDTKCLAEVYQPSPRPYTGLPDIEYPLHDKTIVVTRCGRICLGTKKSISARSLLDRPSAFKEVHDDIWLVSFLDYDLGYFDPETRVLEPLENPFGPKMSPM